MSRQTRRDNQERQRARKLAAAMTVAATELVLVRHGETDWNRERRLQGQQYPGPPLNDMGWRQSEVAAQVLQQRFSHFDAVVCSDLQRTVQTAQVLAAQYQLQVQTDPRLRERNLGLLQGLTYSEAPIQQPDAWAALQSSSSSCRIPGGGESLDDLQQRMSETLLDIAQQYPGKRVLLVSHGGALHATHRAARGFSAKGKVLNCSISVIMAEPLTSNKQEHMRGKHCQPQEQPQQQQQQQQQQQALGLDQLDQATCFCGSRNSSNNSNETKICQASCCVSLQANCTQAGINGAQQHQVQQRCTADGSKCASSDGHAADGGAAGHLALLVWNDGHELAAQGLLEASGFGGSAKEA